MAIKVHLVELKGYFLWWGKMVIKLSIWSLIFGVFNTAYQLGMVLNLAHRGVKKSLKSLKFCDPEPAETLGKKILLNNKFEFQNNVEMSEVERRDEEKPMRHEDERKDYNLGVLKHVQAIFGHLACSKLQYYVPRGFWKHFRLVSVQNTELISISWISLFSCKS